MDTLGGQQLRQSLAGVEGAAFNSRERLETIRLRPDAASKKAWADGQQTATSCQARARTQALRRPPMSAIGQPQSRAIGQGRNSPVSIASLKLDRPSTMSARSHA
jgi:hypothetical protein